MSVDLGIAAIVVAGTVVLVGGIAWLLIRDHQANQRMDQLIRELTVKESVTIEQAILLALTPPRPLYGVPFSPPAGAPRPAPLELAGLDLLKAVQAIRPRTPLGGLYLALAHLEYRGLVASRWGDEVIPERRGARRRYYRRVA